MRRPRPIPDLATYAGAPLTVSQVAGILARAGHPTHVRTIYRWLHCGYLAGHHHLDDTREWRVAVDDLRRLVTRLNGHPASPAA